MPRINKYFNYFGLIILLISSMLILLLPLKESTSTAKIAVLNRLRPEYKKLLILHNNSTNKEHTAHPFKQYFTQILTYMPNRSDAFGLLAYSNYNLNNTSEAINNYKQAIELNPKFFWYYYNLSILYSNINNHQMSVYLLEKALTLSPLTTLNGIIQSQKIYLPLHIQVGNKTGADLEKELRDGYNNGRLLLIYNYEKLNMYDKVLSLSSAGLKTSTQNHDFYFYMLGKIAYKTQNYKRSFEFLQQSLSSNPKYLPSLILMKDIAVRTKQSILSEQLELRIRNNTGNMSDEPTWLLEVF
ncbi:MAG: tetratricopeptide (TPR) repeat protein [Lysobacterales bacterium]|jgi:tetratricopeptide (TPR) repeat protein